MKYAQNAVVIFARRPVPDAVKTRLIGAPLREGVLSANDVARLYDAMLRDTIATALNAVSQLQSSDVVIAHTPDDAFDLPGLNSTIGMWPQGSGDLGARLLRCLEEMQSRGYDRVLIIGSDSPDLPPAYLRAALDELRSCDLVFGPACDGGFYLLGTCCSMPDSLLKNIHWSTPRVLDDVLRNAARLELSTALLPAWRDVDEWSDLQALIARLATEQSQAPLTAGVLASLGLLDS